MKRQTMCWVIALLVLVGLAGPAVAAEPYSYTLGFLAGVGGGLDAEPNSGLDHTLVQLNFGFVSSPRTHVVTRLGHLDLDDQAGFEGLAGADLTYATIGGEYHYLESYYDSGMFFGLGAYRLSGSRDGISTGDTAVGLSFGVTGDFRISGSWSITAELIAHWADLDVVQTFATGQVGVAYHF